MEPFSSILFSCLTLMMCADDAKQTLQAPAVQIVEALTNMPLNDSTVGVPSSHANATRVLKAFLLGGEYIPLSVRNQDYLRNEPHEQIIPALGGAASFRPTRDTNAEEAWQQGWTGRGVKVGHLDDFKDEDIYRPWGERQFTHGEATAFVTFQIAPEIDHAKGNLSFGCGLPTGTQTREIAEVYQSFSDNGYHIVNNSFGSSRYHHNQCTGAPSQLISASDWNDIIDDEIQDDSLQKLALPSGSPDTYNPNMLFVFAAGNDGVAGECPLGLDECNLRAATIYRMRQDGQTEAGDRVLFVGALSDDSFGANNVGLASYSQSAGKMSLDYIVAHDDVYTDNDLGGTSYAAPRAVGAAALVRHKFPNLNGAKLKQVLIQSADDLGDPGPDPVYGSGRLNILAALSPIAGLTSPSSSSSASNDTLGLLVVAAAVAIGVTQFGGSDDDTDESPDEEAFPEVERYLIAGNKHLTSRPWSGAFSAIDGTPHRVEKFYQSTRQQLNFKTALKTWQTRRTKSLLTMHYDNGFAAPLYTAQPYLGLGLSSYIKLGGKTMMSLHALDLWQTGGEITESPCYDGFKREFHCGTGLAWRDVKDHIGERQVDPRFFARIAYRF